jgi:hypothetical protein
MTNPREWMEQYETPFRKEIDRAVAKHGPCAFRICKKCNQERAYPEGYHIKGRGRDSTCRLCRAGEAKARRKSKPPKRKKAPWLNPNAADLGPHRDLIEKYEKDCGLVAVYHALAMVEKDEAKKKGRWAAYYRAVERRAATRAELLKLLPL